MKVVLFSRFDGIRSNEQLARRLTADGQIWASSSRSRRRWIRSANGHAWGDVFSEVKESSWPAGTSISSVTLLGIGCLFCQIAQFRNVEILRKFSDLIVLRLRISRNRFSMCRRWASSTSLPQLDFRGMTAEWSVLCGADGGQRSRSRRCRYRRFQGLQSKNRRS